MTSTKRARWSAGKQLAVLVMAFFGVTFIAYVLGFDPASLSGWTDRAYTALNPFRLWLLAVRWVVFIALWWYWPVIVVRSFPESVPFYEERRAVMLGMRHRVFIVIGVLEIFLQLARL